MVITTPPSAKIGMAGRSSTATRPTRDRPVVDWARRKIPQAESPPTSTAGNLHGRHQRAGPSQAQAAHQLGRAPDQPGDQRPLGEVAPVEPARPGPVFGLVAAEVPVAADEEEDGLQGHHRDDCQDRDPRILPDPGEVGSTRQSDVASSSARRCEAGEGPRENPRDSSGFEAATQFAWCQDRLSVGKLGHPSQIPPTWQSTLAIERTLMDFRPRGVISEGLPPPTWWRAASPPWPSRPSPWRGSWPFPSPWLRRPWCRASGRPN